MVKLFKKLKSDTSVNDVIKYIFLLEDNIITEFTFIDNGSDKDIICVPTQTACDLGCKFCYLTDARGKIINRNLTGEEILSGVKYIYEDLKLSNDRLLVSYMGSGEPLLNTQGLLDSISMILEEYKERIYVRFGLATSIPHNTEKQLIDVAKFIKKNNVDLKIHLSLHYVDNKIRKEWMPSVLEIEPSISLLNYYRTFTNNRVEIHYTAIEGVNDSIDDMIKLKNLLEDKEMPVKFLFYNEKPSIKYEKTARKKVERLSKILNTGNVDTEYYIPPGLDIGASCGQFLLGYYYEFNKK